MKIASSSWAQRVRGVTPKPANRGCRELLARTSALICLTSAIAAPCAAQTVATASPAEADSTGLEEVLVTARRVEERLQDIPASISAVTGDQVARMSSLADLQSMVSGVTFKVYGPIPNI